MPQVFKSIYFSDYLGEEHAKHSLTLAFGQRDAAVYSAVKSLSSQELRQLLDHPSWASLNTAATREGLTPNRLCLRLLRKAVALPANPGQALLPGFFSLPVFAIDPIQSTYRGGSAEPLHNWYPYLEAYSPQFVERVLHEFAPNAASVLDPFGGLGTTPITAAGMGLEAYYCELNPVLQTITSTKIAALSLDGKTRSKVANALSTMAASMQTLLPRTTPDNGLRITYGDCFGRSKFFEDDVFEDVLRARTLVDELCAERPLEAQFIHCAILASLVKSSRLIRRGDLRFKTGSELERPEPRFVLIVADKLRQMAGDLLRLKPLATLPRLLTGDARKLSALPPLAVDALLTSPPYLNGTNYFRNTKVELWFARFLSNGDDLARFRMQAVTAGINDVTIEKRDGEPLPLAVEECAQRVEACAYDVRIPRMVRAYFADMRSVLRSAIRHLSSGAPLLIDIGDSAYAGVHVPTNRLLVEMMSVEDYHLEREVVLRRRLSRGGMALSQVLMVLRRTAAKAHNGGRPASREGLRRGVLWSGFKAQLPHQKGAYAKRNWGHPLHSLCSYQGKMKPSLAHHLVRAFVPAGGRVLDPFSGVGTIPFEAALAGHTSFSFDISPAALAICTAKLGVDDPAECDGIIRKLTGAIEKAGQGGQSTDGVDEIKFNGSLRDYFHPRTLLEILAARDFFLTNPPRDCSSSLVFASLLHVLHGNRPYALSRNSHPITPFAPTGATEYRALIPRLREKVARSHAVGRSDEFVPGTVFKQDATAIWPDAVCELDAIITSPPFFDSTRFYLANWMRLWFCGWNKRDFQVKPLTFVDERQKVDFDIYQPIFRQARERLKAGGVFVLHLGKSRKCDMAMELAKRARPWFRVAEVFSESVEHCESHGIRDKGTVNEHTYLVLD